MKIIKYIPIAILSLMWACDNNNDDNNTVKEITKEVSALAIDKNNVKWVGTKDGLYKSVEDGYKLQKLSASGKIFSLFYEETANTLWIGTTSSLLKANISGSEISDETIANNNLSNPTVYSTYIDNNSNRWFGTELGLSLNKGNTWKTEDFRVNEQDVIFAMPIEEYTINSIASWDGDYYFATSGAKLYRAVDFDETVDAFSGATQWDVPYNGERISDTMFVVFVDSKGNQWMGGTKGLQAHIGHDPKQENYDFTSSVPDTYILAVNEAPNGDIWVGTRKGIAVFDGNNWTTITAGLPDLYITSISFDKEGKAWIGTKKGLSVID